jgi:hypothetical protein
MFRFETCFSSSLELVIGLWSNFEGVEPLEDFVEELYDSSDYKLTWMFVIIFSA